MNWIHKVYFKKMYRAIEKNGSHITDAHPSKDLNGNLKNCAGGVYSLSKESVRFLHATGESDPEAEITMRAQ